MPAEWMQAFPTCTFAEMPLTSEQYSTHVYIWKFMSS